MLATDVASQTLCLRPTVAAVLANIAARLAGGLLCCNGAVFCRDSLIAVHAGTPNAVSPTEVSPAVSAAMASPSI